MEPRTAMPMTSILAQVAILLVVGSLLSFLACAWAFLTIRSSDDQALCITAMILGIAGVVLSGCAAWLAHQHFRNRSSGKAKAGLIAGTDSVSCFWEEATAHRSARMDSITSLPNRLAFSEHLKRLEYRGTAQAGILLVNLNSFKEVNETVGRAGGDALLSEVGQRLARLSGGGVFLARLGDDEFAYVLAGSEGVAGQAACLTAELAAALTQPFCLLGRLLHISVSHGLALRYGPDIPFDELVRRANLALRGAKADLAIEARSSSADLEGQLRVEWVHLELGRKQLQRLGALPFGEQFNRYASTGAYEGSAEPTHLVRFKRPITEQDIPPAQVVAAHEGDAA